MCYHAEKEYLENQEQGMRNANILRLSGRETCSTNEVLTIKRATSSAVGLFHDDENVDDLDLQRNAQATRWEKEKRAWETQGDTRMKRIRDSRVIVVPKIFYEFNSKSILIKYFS